MTLPQATHLIRTPEITSNEATLWADLGAGSGLFSFALAELLYPGSTVFAVDKTKTALIKNKPANNVTIQPILKDFGSENMELPLLDGIIAANSLHFIKDKSSCIEGLLRQMKPAAPFLIVEYDMNKASRWVPYPLPYINLTEIFSPLGYRSIKRIGERDSVYNQSKIYSVLITV